MNIKPTNGARLDLQHFNLMPEQIGTLKTNGGGQTKPEPYSGGSLRVKVYKEDTQKDFVRRGLYKHAEAAGLPPAEAAKYADAWAQNQLMHQEGGTTNAYTAKEFDALKREGTSNFDLTEQYSPQALNDLRQRQTAYRASLQIAPNTPPSEMPSISAPQYNDAEQAVNWLTDKITSATGTDNEIGKQFNRLSISSLRLLGQVQEMENAATEKISDTIRAAAPESVDNFLDKFDQTNRETAQALKNADTSVTNNDRMDDVWAAKNGIKRPLAEDLHRKFMYFPEAIPNAVDSAIKGDFKEDDGSYSDKVGKVVGGLNPIGDIRDIIANGKGVIEGKNGAWIGLGASVIGAIPLIGDGGKIVMKAEKEVITETVEKLVKQGVEKEAAEKLAKEEVGKLVKEAVEKRYDEIAKSGHPVQRHGEHITERQLDERAMYGKDPVTGTTDDAFNKFPDGTPKPHQAGKNATKFADKESLVKAENYARNTQNYKDAVSLAEADGSDYLTVKEIKLKDVFGANYKENVFGKTRLGSRKNPTGTTITDFTDGTLTAKFKKDASGSWKLDTMFPEPKP